MAVYNHLWEYWFAFQLKSKKRLSQVWLAEKAGVSAITLRRYLNNTIKAYDPEVVDRLCDALDIPIEKFFYRAEKEQDLLERNHAISELSLSGQLPTDKLNMRG
jgi:transcriptional regulator with XRE-family HTH domain